MGEILRVLYLYARSGDPRADLYASRQQCIGRILTGVIDDPCAQQIGFIDGIIERPVLQALLERKLLAVNFLVIKAAPRPHIMRMQYQLAHCERIEGWDGQFKVDVADLNYQLLPPAAPHLLAAFSSGQLPKVQDSP